MAGCAEGATPLRVSTMTVISNVGPTALDLELLFDAVPVGPAPEEFVYAELARRRQGLRARGVPPSRRGSARAAHAPCKCFDNQVTLVHVVDDAQARSTMNMKVFRNGSVQITGVRCAEHGELAVRRVVELLRTREPCAAAEPAALRAGAQQVCMINCDFSLGAPLRRDRLYRVLRSEHPELLCSFEPCIYPAVKIQYMHSDERPQPDGVCRCPGGLCRMRKAPGACGKVTVAVFESGSVIITGARAEAQIRAAHSFITCVVHAHAALLARPPVVNDARKKGCAMRART